MGEATHVQAIAKRPVWLRVSELGKTVEVDEELKAMELGPSRPLQRFSLFLLSEMGNHGRAFSEEVI